MSQYYIQIVIFLAVLIAVLLVPISLLQRRGSRKKVAPPRTRGE